MPQPRRFSTHPFRAGLIALLVVACGNSAVVSPSTETAASSGPNASGPATNASPTPVSASGPLFDRVLADAIAHAGQPIADRIMGLVAASEAGARAKQTIPTAVPTAPTSLTTGTFENARFLIASFKRVPTLEHEFRGFMAGGVDAIGFDGPNPFHSDLGTSSFTQTEGTLSSRSQMHMTIDVAFAGSDVTATFTTDIQNSVTDTTSGTTVLTETAKHVTKGDLNACPTAAGALPGSMDISVDEDASTFAGAGGSASHATGNSTRSSQFMATTDDSATMGTISQTYTEQKHFKRTATGADGTEATSEGAYTVGASGIQDGAARDRGIGANVGDWSGATRADDQLSGDMTADQVHGIDTNAGFDYTSIEAAYLEAQKILRDSRCVIVTAPTYIPRSAFEHNAKPTHSEDVEKGSTTVFQVGLDHRYGQAVSAKINVEFDGKESVSPDVVGQPPGSLTYVAPDEDGQDAHVTLTSTSRQGIGRTVLTFHTGQKKLKVSVDGTMITSGLGVSYTTTLHVKDMLLTMTSDPPKLTHDGTKLIPYAGSGPATAEILLGIADCRKPWTQKGTIKLKATHDVSVDDTYEGKWLISFDPSTSFSFTGTCVGVPMESFVGTGETGPIAGMWFVLGDVPISVGATSEHVKKTTNIGPTTNAIDVTVKAEVVSGS